MQSDSFQSGPPGGGSDDELPTVRVRPSDLGSTPTPPEQPGAFPPAPQPDFGAPTSYPPAGSGATPQYPPPGAGFQPQPGFGPPPAQPAFGTPPPQGYPPQPAFGSQPQPGFGTPPQPGFGTPPPQGYPPPTQPGYGAPPQGYPSTQPNFSAPPPGFSGTQPGYGMPPQGYPPQPGFPPPGGSFSSPPRKKGRGGLIAIITIIVIVVLIIGVVGVLALGKKPNSTTGSSSTPTVAPSPTSSVPAGFQKFSNSQFSIEYPGDWTAKSGSSGEEDFTSQAGQIFQIIVQPGQDQSEIATLLSTLCSIFGKPIGSVTTVVIGGQPWQQETCGDNGNPTGTVEATLHQTSVFSIDYASLGGTYTADKPQFFTPMEQSFAFAS